MNERIRELAEQAKEHARKYVADCRNYGFYMEHNEYELQFEKKFAELILEEATDIVYDMLDDNTGAEVVVAVREHFGVDQ